MNSPDPCTRFPLANYNRLCFLKNIVTNSIIIIGDFTYYDDFEFVEKIEKNVKYHFDFAGSNPTKEARKRFSEEKIDQRLEICWRDWPIEKITENIQYLTSNDLKTLNSL